MTVITDASIRKLKGASELPFDMVYVDQLEKFNTGQSSFKVPIEQIAPTLEKQDFDIFHVHNLMPLLLSSMMRRVIRCPIVFTFYNTPNLEERAIGYFDSPTLDMALARNIVESSPYNLAIATSKCYYDFAIRLGMPKEKVRLCYLGIEQMDVAPVTMDAARQASKKYFGDQLMDDDLTILLPGRIVQRKGIIEAIKALSIVNQSVGAKLILTGMALPFDEQFGKQVLAEIERNRLKDKVVIPLSTIPRSELQHIYTRADIVITPSYYEGLGMTAIEALLFSRPLVATDVSGLNEIAIHGVNALTVPPRDPTSIASAILELLTNKKLAEKLAENGPSSIKKFDIQEHIKGVESIYNELRKR